MHLSRLQIINFRSLENIEVEFDGLVNVVIGPNAVGKTTILEAIRLAKAILAPRTQNETQQTMISLGLTSPELSNHLRSCLVREKMSAKQLAERVAEHAKGRPAAQKSM